MAGGRADPYAAFRFRVEVDGLVTAGFADCSGLQAETEGEEGREGGVNEYVYKLPKGSKHANLTLRHGVTDSRELWDWYLEVLNSGIGTTKLRRRTVYVVLLDRAKQEPERELWRWQLKEAYPVKW